MTLLLRCLRCGEVAEMDPTDAYGWGLCPGCQRKMCSAIDADLECDEPHHLARFMDRWQKNMLDHPTCWALAEALSSLESVPHGTLA